MTIWVKVCGITNDEDARSVVEAGADAVGVNLVPSSRRAVDIATARRLRETIGDRARVVAVVADLEPQELSEVRERTGIRWLQLHGNEPANVLAEVVPDAYKAGRVAGPEDVPPLASYGGELLLVDAKVTGELGGTGRTFDWKLVTELARERAIVLAGGLTAENVGDAVRFVRPFGVDTASGVEGADPRRKDADKVARFVRAARAALLAVAAFSLFACSSRPDPRVLVAPGTPLPGVVAGVFAAERCRDASGAPVTLGPRLFVALAPPGMVGAPGPISRGEYPPGVITLLDQRVGYEAALLSQGERHGRELVYELPFETRGGKTMVEEIRLPVDLSSNGRLSLAGTRPTAAATPAGTPGARKPVVGCELTNLAPRLDTREHVDYEPGRVSWRGDTPESDKP